jgi:hypothetical protein
MVKFCQILPNFDLHKGFFIEKIAQILQVLKNVFFQIAIFL